MSALSKVLRQPAAGCLAFWCPGCGHSHQIQHGDGPGPRWGWNGDAERPTFTPSVLVTWSEPSDNPDEFDDTSKDVKKACHSFVTDGHIQFLGDCTHALAGQTVPLAEFPEGVGMLMPTIPWRAAGAALAAAALFAAGWAVNGWRKDAELAELTAARAQSDLAGANQALGDLRTASANIRAHADEFTAIQSTLGTKLDAIQKELKNAKPLPVDCRPDAGRVRLLSDAVDAAKQAAAAR